MILEAARSMLFEGESLRGPSIMARLSFTRSQESAADEFAAKTMALLGIPPSSLGVALLRVSSSRNLAAKTDIFSDHPLTADRVKALAAYKAAEKSGSDPLVLPDWRRLDLACQ
jgi:predicted Zn-dependent protease